MLKLLTTSNFLLGMYFDIYMFKAYNSNLGKDCELVDYADYLQFLFVLCMIVC